MKKKTTEVTSIKLDKHTAEIAKQYIPLFKQAQFELNKIVIITCGARNLDPSKWTLSENGETLVLIKEANNGY
jgi:hypothetical protein